MTRIPSINIAIENEKREMEFYLNEAQHSLNPMARYLFETLASDEQDHIDLLRKLHTSLVDEEKWPEDIAAKIADNNILSAMKNAVQRQVSREDHVDSDIDALRKSVLFEASAVEFYVRIANECENPMEQKFFRYLAEIEEKHMLAIKDTLLFLENPDAWHEAHDDDS
jgi:rubrerythrin